MYSLLGWYSEGRYVAIHSSPAVAPLCPRRSATCSCAFVSGNIDVRICAQTELEEADHDLEDVVFFLQAQQRVNEERKKRKRGGKTSSKTPTVRDVSSSTRRRGGKRKPSSKSSPRA